MAENDERELMEGGDLAFRVTVPGEMHFRDEGEGSPEVSGRMMPYGEWTEIKSRVEGHFMERFAPAALAKSISEQASRIRLIFEHGRDAALGRQALGDFSELRDDTDGAHFRAALLEGVPQLVVSGLKRGLYGSSILFEPIKWDRVRYPGRSDWNPAGIAEHTIREARVREISITAFPAYAGATAHVRSITDEVAAKQLLGDPVQFLELLRNMAEPPHSEPVEEDAPPAESRRTQPSHDYTRPKEEQSWRL